MKLVNFDVEFNVPENLQIILVRILRGDINIFGSKISDIKVWIDQFDLTKQSVNNGNLN